VTQGFAHPFRVRFQDVDAAGIVFFGRYLDHAHEAYDAFLRAKGVPIAAELEGGEILVPVVKAEAEYHAPLRYGESGHVRVTVARLGTTSATFRMELVSEGGRAVATVTTTNVCVGRDDFRPRPWPEAYRAAFAGAIEAPRPVA